MKTFVDGNVTLIQEDRDELYLSIKDLDTNILQEYAILPEELPRIKEVIERYLEKKV
jgi:DNA-directed RNA polymerase subunit H (RpoH/RPB5)